MVTGKPHKPSKFVRLVLYPAIGVLFALVLGAILMLASGYRFTYENGKVGLVQTGMLIVSSRPFDGQIFINSKATKYKSGFYLLPTKIPGLKPGSYDVEVAKKGFRSWSGKLEVAPNKVAWANYILLFAEKLNITKVDAPIGSFLTSSSNGRHILLSSQVDSKFRLESLDSNNLSIKDFWPTNQTFSESWLKSPQITFAKYSVNNDRVVLGLKNGAGNEFVVLDASGSQPKLIKLSALGRPFTRAWWSSVSNNEIYLESENSVYLVNINDTKLANAILTNVISFSVEEGRQAFYVVTDSAGVYSIGRMNLDGGNKTVVAESVLPSSGYKLGFSSQQDMLAVLSDDSQSLTAYYLGSSGKKHTLALSSGVTSFGWSKNGRKLYYYGKDFVKRYDWEKDHEVTTKLESTPLSVNWYFDEYHYLVRTEKDAFVMDFDGYNRVPILETATNTWVFDRANDNIIYSTKDTNNVETYYKYVSGF